MYTKIYEVPSSLKELFEQGEASYRIVDYTPEMEMDNNQSMEFFINHLGILPESITEDYGTQVVITHPDYSHQLVIDAGGLGDFFSHGYDITIYQP